MKPLIFGLMVLLASVGGRAASAFPLTGTLPKEQGALLVCTVSDTSMAKDCGPPPGQALASESQKTLMQAESADPDYLAGATPGQQVMVLARRSLASTLDGGNPGRATPATPANQALVTDPDWVKMPKGSDINGYFPDRALRMGASGSATVVCTVGPKGDLVGCWMVAEAPADFAFGVELLKLSSFVQMSPVTKSGEPAVGRPYALQAAFDIKPNSRSFGITLSTAQ